jgi:protein KRI1
LEGDFDPQEHDKRMRQLFNCEYYNEDENEKPEFPELDEELEIGKQNVEYRTEFVHSEVGWSELRYRVGQLSSRTAYI